jgi:ferric-dicitrate binding protein FerR (iron transport regulator)
MSHPDSIEQILKSYRDATPTPLVEQRIIAVALGRAGRRRARLRWRVVAPLGLATVGAAAVVIWVTSPARLAVQAQVHPVVGQSLEAVAEPLHLAVGGHQLDLLPGGRATFASVDPAHVEVRLEVGILDCSVHRLHDDESFRVATDDAVAVAVGTQFRVARSGGCTQVSVSEGTVRATAAAGSLQVLPAGSATVFCPGSAAAGEASDDELVRTAITRAAIGADLEEAERLLRRYLAQHPSGILSEEATFQLSLIVARLGRHAEAARLADDFERQFPPSGRAARLRQMLGQMQPK